MTSSNRDTRSDPEKRRQTRVPVEDEIFVRDTVSGLVLGTLANIHDEGFMVISDGGLKEDHLYQLALETHPDALPIHLGAECLWISETGTGDQIWAGFHIVDLSDDAHERLAALVVAHQD